MKKIFTQEEEALMFEFAELAVKQMRIHSPETERMKEIKKIFQLDGTDIMKWAVKNGQ